MNRRICLVSLHVWSSDDTSPKHQSCWGHTTVPNASKKHPWSPPEIAKFLFCWVFFGMDNLENEMEKAARSLGRWRTFIAITLLEKLQKRNLLAHILSANCKPTMSRTASSPWAEPHVSKEATEMQHPRWTVLKATHYQLVLSDQILYLGHYLNTKCWGLTLPFLNWILKKFQKTFQKSEHHFCGSKLSPDTGIASNRRLLHGQSATL